jgi:large subunit ribosomal protein L22
MEKQYVQKKAKAAQLKQQAPTKEEKQPQAQQAAVQKFPEKEQPPTEKKQEIAKEQQESKPESKEEAKPETKPKKETPKVKKEEAIAYGLNLHASKKHCMYICTFIKNKPIDFAIKELQAVIALKRPIPFKGEIPHRSYPGMMSGRYPIKASSQFIYLLKALKGNVIANGMDLDKSWIVFASANWASRPQKRTGGRFKRTNVLLKAKEITAEEKK